MLRRLADSTALSTQCVQCILNPFFTARMGAKLQKCCCNNALPFLHIVGRDSEPSLFSRLGMVVWKGFGM